jgi:hypothetical protein
MQTMKRGGLKLGALALAAAGLIEYALQIILPVILVRHLTPADFGEYRLVWLLAASAVPLFVLSFPHSLFYTVKATALVLVADKPVLAGLPLLGHLSDKVGLYCVCLLPLVGISGLWHSARESFGDVIRIELPRFAR